jgi:hypothetical protein
MIATALLLSLAATPSAAALSGSASLRGALVRVDAVVADDTQPQVPLDQMTREQLRAEYRRLDESRPSLGGQIAAVVLGGVTIASGVIVLYGSFIVALFGTAPITAIVIGCGLILGGAAVLTVGIIMLKAVIAERRPYGEAMQEIQERLDNKYEENHPPEQRAPPPYDPVVPPPPPPPPAAGFQDLKPSLVLATF